MQLPFTESNDMLTLVDIKKKDASHCIVTLNRDGKEMVYKFHLHIPGPDDPNGLLVIEPPIEIDYDLIDYNIDFPQSRSKGAICIPFMRRISTLVSQVARNIPVELPQVLDER